ncbi:MAG: hypothetical protein V4559_01415 [Pseudomonadota bacterium]
MSDRTNRHTLERNLISRPQAVIAAEQKRHDHARVRGLTAIFTVLVVGGGLAAFVVFGPLFRGQIALQAILVGIVFGAPFLASFIMMLRVPPPPFEASGDARREMDQKQVQWRIALLTQVFVLSLCAAETFWLWPRLARVLGWISALISLLPVVFIVFLVISSLYMNPSWLNPDLRRFLDDEVTRSFRARAQRLGYLLMMFVLLGFCLLARISAQAAAQFMPLGLALGAALPILYFVYLDWQADRGG